MSRALVTVEIGNDWLKIAEGKSLGKGEFAFRFNFTKLAQISGSVSSAASNIFREMKLSKSEALIYIPRQLVTVRILDFPSVNPKEIAEMVNFQVGKQTPYSKEEVVSAHKIIGSDKEGYTKVILVIAKSSIINERLEILKSLGIRPKLVGLSTEAVCNWFNVVCAAQISPSYQTVIILDIDSNYSDFIALRKGKLVFTRSILMGANRLLGELKDWQDNFIEELTHSLQLYRDEEKDVKIDRIFLTGSAKQIKELDNLLAAKLDIPVTVIAAQNGLSANKGLTLLEEEQFRAFSVTALLGSIFRRQDLEIDLSGSHLRIQRMLEIRRKQLTLSGALAGFIVTLLSISLLVNVYNQRAYLLLLKSDIAKIENEAKEVEKARSGISLIEKRLDAKGSAVNILKNIHQLLPPQVYLSSLDIEESNKIILKGRGLAMSDIFNLVTILEKSRFFKNVKNTYTTTKKEDNTEFTEFEITANIQG
ncbi:MAG: pilus assembly protein PilM [Candidatus Omnitrophota bacterium]